MLTHSIFIMRCWKENNDVRFRLENPHSGETHLFNSLDALQAFLAQLLDLPTSAHLDQGDSHV